MDPMKDIPYEVQLGASAALLSRRRANALRSLELGDQLHQLRALAIEELVSTFGQDRYYEYLRICRDTQQRLRSLGTQTSFIIDRPPSTETAPTAQEESRQQILADARSLLDKIGISGATIGDLRRKHTERLDALNVILPDEQAVTSAELGLGQEFKPPFPYESTYPVYYGSSAAKFDPPRGTICVKAGASSFTGNLNICSWVEIADASNYEYAYSTAEASVLFWFQMPASGRLKVRPQLIARDVRFTGLARDEFGFSYLQGGFRFACFANVVNPGVDLMGGYRLFANSTGRNSDLRVIIRGDDYDWYFTAVETGYENIHVFTSEQTYSAGTWLLLEVGIYSYNNWEEANDMSCIAHNKNDWTIKAVHVEVDNAA
jgi:hypothetical protein